MSHVPHDLHAEFADDAEILHRLKLSDPRFQHIAEEYHGVNREIHRIETDLAPAADHHLEDLKKQRLSLLDEVARMIARTKVA